MVLQEAYRQLLFKLYELYDNREAANIADLVIEHITGQRRIDRVMNKQMPVSATAQKQLDDYATQLLLHTPVQYVLLEAWFAGIKFYVDENVLIPRPETEELVEWVASCGLQVSGFQFPVNVKNPEKFTAIKDENKRRPPATGNQQPVTVLDIGTGSGCIPVALKKKFQGWDVNALDISAGALQVAQRNAAQLQTPITFYQADILKEEDWLQLPMFDIIVSNPPYIKQSEAANMLRNVTRFEPHSALFVPDDDALVFYKKIVEFALLHLQPNGLLFFEINESLGAEVCSVLAGKGFVDIELKKDMQGKDRMVRGRRGR